MKLQVAMDTLNPQELITFFEKIKKWVDIVELGTPYLLRYGTDIIFRLRSLSQTVEILCDAKIVDAGYYEASELYEAGADYVTVLAVAQRATLEDVVRAAKAYGRRTAADMICVKDVPEKIRELEAVGIDVLAVHTGVDEQAKGRTPLEDLKIMKRCGNKVQTAVAGGIAVDTLEEYLKLEPDIVVVGGGILKAEDPVLETKRLYEKIKAVRRYDF